MLYNPLALSFVSHLNFTPKPGSCTAFCTEPGFVFFRAASLFVRQPLPELFLDMNPLRKDRKLSTIFLNFMVQREKLI